MIIRRLYGIEHRGRGVMMQTANIPPKSVAQTGVETRVICETGKNDRVRLIRELSRKLPPEAFTDSPRVWRLTIPPNDPISDWNAPISDCVTIETLDYHITPLRPHGYYVVCEGVVV